jgi:hypothetical protein
MKKHIEKKFMHQFKLDETIIKAAQASGASVPLEHIPTLKKFPKDKIAFAISDNGYAFQTFPYTYQGAVRFIPEPDPVLVYFHSAYLNFRHIEERKREILKAILQTHMPEAMANGLYEYFNLTSGFVIFLFTAMEAFINRTVPRDYVYKKPTGKNTEHYTKKQIEEFIGFKDKMTIILPEVTKKSFQTKYPMKYQHIINLKEYRDSIVHTKSAEDGRSTFEYLYKRALDFKYEETISAVKDFCNFYEPDGNLIVECSCNHDW